MNEMDINLQGETEKKQLSISIHVDKSQSMDLHVYSPYWIINKTGLPLQLRVSNLTFCWRLPGEMLVLVDLSCFHTDVSIIVNNNNERTLHVMSPVAWLVV